MGGLSIIKYDSVVCRRSLLATEVYEVENKYFTRTSLDSKSKPAIFSYILFRDGLLVSCFMIGLKVLNYFNEREVWDSMKQTMDAVYENGVFRPLNPPKLSEKLF